jgi:hypothetical protein
MSEVPNLCTICKHLIDGPRCEGSKAFFVNDQLPSCEYIVLSDKQLDLIQLQFPFQNDYAILNGPCSAACLLEKAERYEGLRQTDPTPIY